MFPGARTAGLSLLVTLSLALSLTLVLPPGAARADVFANPAAMSGLAAATYSGPPAKWNPYPSEISVSGLSGTVSQVTVRINDWYQGNTSYVDMLLVSPDGRRVMLISDAGNSSTTTQAADHINVVFDQTSPITPPPFGGGPLGPKNSTVFLRPTNHPRTPDDFPDLHPDAANAPSDLGILAGAPPNGMWKLYLTFDYAAGPATGQVLGGWSLDITTKPDPPPPPPPPDTTPPLVARISTDDEAFRAAKRGGAVGPTGALIGFRLSEAATVSFDVDRLIPGRRVKDRCQAPTKRRKGKRCVRVKAVPGSFVFTGKAGENLFRFSGRMNGRALRPGRYLLTGLARDAAGNAARAFRVKVTILAPKPAKRRR